jgi:hypothetical protein
MKKLRRPGSRLPLSTEGQLQVVLNHEPPWSTRFIPDEELIASASPLRDNAPSKIALSPLKSDFALARRG